METWSHHVSENVDDSGGNGYPVYDVLDFSGSKWDVCPLESECVLTLTWNGDEAVEVVAMGQWVEALRLESLVEVEPHLHEGS